MNKFAMNTIKTILLFLVLLTTTYGLSAQSDDPVIAAIQKEVERNRTNLKVEGMEPPFFISYYVLDINDYRVNASLGSISTQNEDHRRIGTPKLLVGNYMRNNLNHAGNYNRRYTTSLYDNASGIPITIWSGLDDAYKSAVEKYKEKMAILQQRKQDQEEADLPDFEKVEPVNIILKPVSAEIDKAYWDNYVRKVSEIAKQYPDIINSNVEFYGRKMTTYSYNTEGSRCVKPGMFYQLFFGAGVRTDDGQELFHRIWFENSIFERMPDVATFTNQCKTLMEDLLKLKNAPLVQESYSGPVLFESVAVERLFRQTFFGDNRSLIASRSVINPNNGMMVGGNDLEMMLNKKIISRSLTVKAITGQEFYKGQRLDGYYPVDDEGVAPAKELTLIENGVLRNMLNGRTPTKKIKHSNGHLRFNLEAYAYQVIPGNILITSNQTFSKEELRKKLIATAKEEDLEYAYIVRQYNFGNDMIYRIYVADGREELVRGAAVSEVNLKTYKRILGASDKEEMLNYGSTQATVIYPDALLFEEMDIVRINNIELKQPYIVSKPEM